MRYSLSFSLLKSEQVHIPRVIFGRREVFNRLEKAKRVGPTSCDRPRTDFFICKHINKEPGGIPSSVIIKNLKNCKTVQLLEETTYAKKN